MTQHGIPGAQAGESIAGAAMDPGEETAAFATRRVGTMAFDGVGLWSKRLAPIRAGPARERQPAHGVAPTGTPGVWCLMVVVIALPVGWPTGQQRSCCALGARGGVRGGSGLARRRRVGHVVGVFLGEICETSGLSRPP